MKPIRKTLGGKNVQVYEMLKSWSTYSGGAARSNGRRSRHPSHHA